MLVPALVSGLVLGAIYALVGTSLNLIFGVIKVINFAHGAFLMLAVYITYWTTLVLGIDAYLTLPVVVVVMAAFGYVFQSVLINPVLNKHRISQLLITFGAGMAITNGVQAVAGADHHSVHTFLSSTVWTFGSVRMDASALVLIAGTASSIGLLFLFLNRTRLGTAIRAVSQQPDSAELAGINVKRIYAIAFAIGSALVGIAAVLMAPIYDINPSMGEVFGIMAFIVVVLGGLGNIQGAALGGLVLGVGQNLFASYVSFQMSIAFVFLFFIIILLVRPTGLFGRAARVA